MWAGGTGDLPNPYLHLLLAKLLPDPSHGGPGTHLIAPGIVPALTSWPLPGQPTSPAWKNPHQSRLICLWRAESGRGGGWARGELWSRGSPALSPALDTTGPDTGDSAISGAHPPSQIAPAWEEVSLMLPRVGNTWPHSWLNSRSEAGLRLVHTRSPSQTPHPGPLDCGTTSQVHHT